MNPQDLMTHDFVWKWREPPCSFPNWLGLNEHAYSGASAMTIDTTREQLRELSKLMFPSKGNSMFDDSFKNKENNMKLYQYFMFTDGIEEGDEPSKQGFFTAVSEVSAREFLSHKMTDDEFTSYKTGNIIIVLKCVTEL